METRPFHARALGFIFGSLLVVLTSSPRLSAAETVLTLGRLGESVPIVELTLEQLDEMPKIMIATENEFADGVVTYRGPLARDVIAPLGVDRDATLRLTAANDYSIDIPVSDFFDFDVILAMEADGKRLSRREKGPLWLMYPISDHPKFRGRPYSDRLIWQVVRIEAP